MGDRVLNVKNLKGEMDLVDVEHELDDVGGLLLGSDLPLAAALLSQARCTLNSQPVFLIPIGDPIMKLGIRGDPKVYATIQASMALLNEGKTVIMTSAGLLNTTELNIRSCDETLHDELSLIEQVEDEMKAGDGSEMHAIGIELLGDEAGHHVQVVGLGL